MCGRIRFAVIFLLLLPFSPAQTQDKRSGQDDKNRPTFRLPVNLVIVSATVADKDGNPVRDLVQSDFRVYEDGKLQPIQTFAVESYEPDQLEYPGVAPSAVQGSRPRMISLMIDDITAESRDNFPSVIAALKKFVAEDLRPEDQVSLSAGSGRVHFPFTGDKQALLEEIQTLLGKLSFDRITREDCPALTDSQAKMIAERYADGQSMQDYDYKIALDETISCMGLDPTDEKSVRVAGPFLRSTASRQNQESEYRSSTLLNSLRQHLRTLRHFDSAKSLILFSNGFLSQGVSSISYGLQDVVEQALASGVILNTVDMRGLYTAMPPVSERMTSATSNAAAYRLSQYLADASARDAPLAQIASETGGLFFHNNNDILRGLKTISHRNSFYYVLTYAMPPQKADGRFHQIKLELTRPGLEISYRKGYHAPREEQTFERRKKEDILEALRAPGNLNEIRMGLAYNYYQEDATTYRVALLTNVSIRGLHFLDENSRRKNIIHVVVAAFDEADHYIDGIEKSIDFKLTETSYANVLTHGINSKVEFKLPLGRYKIKAVVREGAEGKMGSVTRTVEIP